MSVENDLPTSWKSKSGLGLGVSMMKTNLMGRGTSRALGMMMPSARRTRATAGLQRKEAYCEKDQESFK